MSLIRISKALLLSLVLIGPASLLQAEEKSAEIDPLENINRSIFSFNEALDQNLLLPITKGYRAITPEIVQTGVSNFFSNLGDVGVLVNNMFQLKFHDSVETFARLVANTFFGIGGLIDVATPLGIEKQNEDFGQTLGYWGVDSGPYVVLPFFGPSSVRDGIGKIPDYYLYPVNHIEDDEARLSLQVLTVIDTRSKLMEVERLISGDRYTFIRDAYLQRREHLVNDGEVSAEYKDDGF